MPITPSTWLTNTPITAHQLNQDLYTIDGSYFNANGVMFHSNRPMLIEYYSVNSLIKAPAGGAFTVLGGTDGVAISILDNAALYGGGSDGVGDSARFDSSGAVAPSSAGVNGQPGGWNLFVNFIQLRNFSNTAATYASCWAQNTNILLDMGAPQPGNSVNGNTGFAVDLIERQPNLPGQFYQAAVWALDPNNITNTINTNTVTTVGGGVRYAEIWCGVTNGNGNTVSSVPSPIASVTGTTQLSAATFNTAIQQTFNLLNYPPMLNCQLPLTGSNVTTVANTLKVVPFNETPLVDNYSGYSTASTTYTVPLAGIYFCHATVLYGQNYNTGEMFFGFQVNSSTATTYYGGAYNATASNFAAAGCSATKVLDLHAGDTLSVVTESSVAGTISTQNGVSRFIAVWMAPINTTIQTWVPPDVTGFQFAAATPPGTAATQLAGLMNTKIANDINFLLNRPYLTVHQTTAQSGLTSATWNSVTMQSTVGLVHGSLGDNYAGWSSTHNWYVAPVSGWYLAISEVNAATISTANAHNSVVAGFSVPTSGGIPAPTVPFAMPDAYQYITVANGWTYPTGATAMNVYYLLQGETIQPSINYETVASTATFNTDVSHNFESHFNVIWMAN